MSVIRKKPFIEGVVDKLTIAQKGALLNVMNTAGNNVSASLLEMPAKGITPVLFKLDEANLKTGILIYLDDVPVTLIAYHRFQDVLLFELHPESTTYNKINEYCDINELRRILTVGEEVTAGEIDSGDAQANKVLAADGSGGATWKDTLDTITPENVESGDAVQLFGFDAQGNLVKDDMPEGIVVDQSVIEDSENAVAGGAVYDFAYSKEDVNGLLETKANVDGNYPTMTVGVADQLSPYDEESGDDQDEPFSFQATGTGNGSQPDFSTGSIALMKEKRGNTVVVNQLMGNGNFADLSGWNINNGTASVSNGVLTVSNIDTADFQIARGLKITLGHKYLFMFNYDLSQITGADFLRIMLTDGLDYPGFTSELDNNNLFGAIWTNNSFGGTQYCAIQMVSYNGTVQGTFKVSNYICIDLTQWFNGDIPQDLLDNPENFYRYYQGSLAYNAGALVNANSRYLKAIGMNQVIGSTEDKVYESGDDLDFKPIPNLTYFVSLHSSADGLVTLMANDGTYLLASASLTANDDVYHTFTAPSKLLEGIKIFTSNSAVLTKVCVRIYYEGEGGYIDTQTNKPIYYPYELLTNNDTGTETLRSAGSVSDSKAPDGTITRRVLVSDTINDMSLSRIEVDTDIYAFLYSYYSTYGEHNILKIPSSNNDVGDITSVLTTSARNQLVFNDLMICIQTDGQILMRDDSCADVAAFKTKYGSNVLYLALAEPTTEQGTQYSENIVIDDFGSMDFGGTSGVPQGNLIFYPVDYKAFIDTLYNYTEGTPSNIALKSDVAALKNYVDAKLPTPPTTAGKYRLTVTIADGEEPVYEWESEA